MKVFFDTSAFVKRYVNETGSQAVVEICQNADTLALSIICGKNLKTEKPNQWLN